MLNVNTVFVDLAEQKTYRILWLSITSNILYAVELNSNGMPISKKVSDLQKQLDNAEIEIIKDSWIAAALPDEFLRKQDIRFRDSAWETIYQLVECEPEIYDRNSRGQMIQDAAIEKNVSYKTLYNYIKKYWKGGKTKNAFLPNYKNCGAKGTKRCSVNGKIGRPSKYGSGSARNVDDEIKIIFEKAIKKYYHNRNEYPLSTVYELIENQ